MEMMVNTLSLLDVRRNFLMEFSAFFPSNMIQKLSAIGSQSINPYSTHIIYTRRCAQQETWGAIIYTGTFTACVCSTCMVRGCISTSNVELAWWHLIRRSVWLDYDLRPIKQEACSHLDASFSGLECSARGCTANESHSQQSCLAM